MSSQLSKQHPCVRTAFAATLLAISACGAEEEMVVCGGNGEMHGDHCHCNSGYELTEDETSCVQAPEPRPNNEQNPSNQTSDSLDFNPSNPRGATTTAEDGTRVWLVEAIDGATALTIELYEAYGGPTTAGVVEMIQQETSYATCGTCLILRTGCVAHNDHMDCQKSFMPRAEGQMEIQTLGMSPGQRLSGSLSDLVFQEVTIGSRGQTNPVTGGELFELNSWPFNVRLEALNGPEAACSGHGQLHGDHCDCDPGYRRDPQDPMRCIPG